MNVLVQKLGISIVSHIVIVRKVLTSAIIFRQVLTYSSGVIRWRSESNISYTPPHQFFHIIKRNGITAHQPMVTKLPHIALLASHFDVVLALIEVIFFHLLRSRNGFKILSVPSRHSPLWKRKVIPFVGEHIVVPRSEGSVILDDNLTQLLYRSVLWHHHTRRIHCIHFPQC